MTGLSSPGLPMADEILLFREWKEHSVLLKRVFIHVSIVYAITYLLTMYCDCCWNNFKLSTHVQLAQYRLDMGPAEQPISRYCGGSSMWYCGLLNIIDLPSNGNKMILHLLEMKVQAVPQMEARVIMDGTCGHLHVLVGEMHKYHGSEIAYVIHFNHTYPLQWLHRCLCLGVFSPCKLMYHSFRLRLLGPRSRKFEFLYLRRRACLVVRSPLSIDLVNELHKLCESCKICSLLPLRNLRNYVIRFFVRIPGIRYSPIRIGLIPHVRTHGNRSATPL